MLGFPLCFDSKADYQSWLRTHKASPSPLPPRLGHCWDCTPLRQAAMKAAGRCMQPRTQFVAFVEYEDCDLDVGPPDVVVHGIPEGVFDALFMLSEFARGE